MKRAAIVTGITLALVAGVVFRFWTRSHLWLDEALSVNIARLPLGDIPSALRGDGHPPLYYGLLHGWMEVWGDGDVAVRALSGVLSVLALPVAWLLGRRIGGSAAAWTLTVAFALTPFAIRYGTEARMYSLVMLLVLAGHLALLRALERPTVGRLAVVTAICATLVLTHYWALWLVVAVVTVLGWDVVRQSGPARSPSRRVVAALFVGALALLPWAGVMLDQAAHTGTPWGEVARPATLVASTLRDFGGGDYTEAVLLGWGLAGLCLLGVFARRVDGDHLEVDLRGRGPARAEAVVVALTMSFAWVGSVLVDSTYASRYASVLLPIILVLVTRGLLELRDTRALLPVVTLLAVLALVGGVANVITDRTQAGDIAAEIRSGASPGDLVVICPDQLGPSVSRGLPESLGLVTLRYPDLGDPTRVEWRDYVERSRAADPEAVAAKGLVQRATAGESVWVVASGAYRGTEGQCDALRRRLTTALGGERLVVAPDDENFGEAASLVVFGPGRPLTPQSGMARKTSKRYGPRRWPLGESRSASLVVGLVACSDDDSDGGSPTTESSSRSSSSTTAPERAASTTTTAFDPASVEGEVEAAYLRSWDVYADAVYDLVLDEEALESVYGEALLEVTRTEIEKRIEEGRAALVRIEHDYSVELTGADTAVLVDRYVNHQVLIDPESKEPIEDDPNEIIADAFDLRREDGRWVVVDQVRIT